CGSTRDVFNGFYVDSQLTRLSLEVGIAAGLGASIGVASAGVEGGLFAELSAKLNDPDKDGKLRFKEIRELIDVSPICLIELEGKLTARLMVFFRILFGPRVRINLVPPITLVDFTVRCPQPEAVLASLSGDGTLTLHRGPLARNRIRRNTTDGDEVFAIVHTGGAAGSEEVEVSAFGVTQRFRGVRRIVGDSGQGNDTITL